MQHHPSFSLFLIGMLTRTKQDKPQHGSVLFHLVLKAYSTWHSWIITAHVFLGELNKQLHMFNHQEESAHQLLMKLQCQLFTSNFVLNDLLGELTNIDSIYQLYRPTMQMTIQLLQTEPVLNRLSPSDSPYPKRSLLPFLGNALQWLSETATMKDIREIKQWINQLMQEQKEQQETLVHIISILNITSHVTQMNGQKLNKVMDALQKVNEDVNTLLNITDILTQHLRNTHNICLCPYYTSIPERLPHIHETRCHTNSGLCWCSYDQHIVTQYTASRKTQKCAQTFCISTTFNSAPAHIIGWHPPFLPVP